MRIFELITNVYSTKCFHEIFEMFLFVWLYEISRSTINRQIKFCRNKITSLKESLTNHNELISTFPCLVRSSIRPKLKNITYHP